jgi:hypothetical protein
MGRAPSLSLCVCVCGCGWGRGKPYLPVAEVGPLPLFLMEKGSGPAHGLAGRLFACESNTRSTRRVCVCAPP